MNHILQEVYQLIYLLYMCTDHLYLFVCKMGEHMTSMESVWNPWNIFIPHGFHMECGKVNNIAVD